MPGAATTRAAPPAQRRLPTVLGWMPVQLLLLFIILAAIDVACQLLGARLVHAAPAPLRAATRLLTALSRTQPLCIDELGYLNLKPEQVNAFFRLMDQRYGRVSTIITTNLEYSSWYGLFDNKPVEAGAEEE